MEQIADRIKNKRKALKLTQAQVARRLKVATSAVTQYETGTTKPSGENLFKIAVILKCTPEWLLYGCIKSNVKKIEPQDACRNEISNSTFIPLVKGVVMPDITKLRKSKEKHEISKFFLESSGVTEEGAIALEIQGNSMYPLLPEKTIVSIKLMHSADIADIKEGSMYAIEHESVLSIKILYRAGSGLRLRCFNQDEYPDEKYTAEEAKKIRIVGKVFCTQSFYE